MVPNQVRWMCVAGVLVVLGGLLATMPKVQAQSAASDGSDPQIVTFDETNMPPDMRVYVNAGDDPLGQKVKKAHELRNQASEQAMRRNMKTALGFAAQSDALYSELLADDPDNFGFLYSQSQLHAVLAQGFVIQEEWDKAASEYQMATGLLSRMKTQGVDKVYQLTTLSNFSLMRGMVGFSNYADAENLVHFEFGLRAAEQLWSTNPHDQAYIDLLGKGLYNLAYAAYFYTEDDDRAYALLSRAIATHEDAYRRDATQILNVLFASSYTLESARILTAAGRYDEAGARADVAMANFVKIVEQNPNAPEMKVNLARAHYLKGELNRLNGRKDEAFAFYQTADELYETAIQTSPVAVSEWLLVRALNTGSLADIYFARGDKERAAKLYKVALEEMDVHFQAHSPFAWLDRYEHFEAQLKAFQ